MIVWLGDGWCEWGKGEGDWARRRTTKLGRKIEDEVGVCEGRWRRAVRVMREG
jgi:hypothetical protein